MPKLKVRYDIEDESSGRIVELEEARGFYYGFDEGHPLVVVEGHPVNSYKELAELAARAGYREKEFLKVQLRQVVLGGG